MVPVDRPEGSEIELDLPSLARPGMDWGDRPAVSRSAPGPPAEEWHGLDDGDDEPEPGEAAIRIVASAIEVLESKSFADLSEEERGGRPV